MVEIVQAPSFILPRAAGEDTEVGVERSAAVERFEQLERLLSAYRRHLRRLHRMQRVFRLLAIQIERADDGNIIHGKQDRFLSLREIDMLMPGPIGNRKAIMLGPFQRLLTDDRCSLAAYHEIGGA